MAPETCDPLLASIEEYLESRGGRPRAAWPEQGRPADPIVPARSCSVSPRRGSWSMGTASPHSRDGRGDDAVRRADRAQRLPPVRRRAASTKGRSRSDKVGTHRRIRMKDLLALQAESVDAARHAVIDRLASEAQDRRSTFCTSDCLGPWSADASWTPTSAEGPRRLLPLLEAERIAAHEADPRKAAQAGCGRRPDLHPAGIRRRVDAMNEACSAAAANSSRRDRSRSRPEADPPDRVS